MQPNKRIHDRILALPNVVVVSIARANFKKLAFDDTDYWEYKLKAPDFSLVEMNVLVFDRSSSISFRKQEAGQNAYDWFAFDHYLRFVHSEAEMAIVKKFVKPDEFEDHFFKVMNILEKYITDQLRGVALGEGWIRVPFDWSDFPGK